VEMLPIHELLHRIQWDAEFGNAEFEVRYLDRVADRMASVSWRNVRFAKGEHFVFEATEEDGSVHSVPLHRVREVWRNGELIWRRAPSSPAGS
jgi:uncharacterized protein (UPF0248 family)